MELPDRVLYASKCACNSITRTYASPYAWGLSHIASAADIGGRTCRCGNGGFIFHIVSAKWRRELERRAGGKETIHDLTR